MRVYKDGQEQSSDNEVGPVSTNDTVQVWIGANPPNLYDPWRGRIGEVRVSNIGRSPDWIAAQNKSMHENSFVTYGLEESW